MYPESDELICEVPSLKVTIRLVLGWPKGQKCQETKNGNQWAPAPRDTVYVSPTLVSCRSSGTLYQWEDNIKGLGGVEPSVLSILILGPRVGFGGLRQLPYVLADIALRHLTTGAIYNMLLARPLS